MLISAGLYMFGGSFGISSGISVYLEAQSVLGIGSTTDLGSYLVSQPYTEMEHHGRRWLSKMRYLDLTYHKSNAQWLTGYQTLEIKWRSIDSKFHCRMITYSKKYWRQKYISIDTKFSLFVKSELVEYFKENSYTETQSRHWIHAKHDISQYSTLTQSLTLLPPMVIQHQHHGYCWSHDVLTYYKPYITSQTRWGCCPRQHLQNSFLCLF